MSEANSPAAIQDYLKELSAATRKVERSFRDKPLDSVDLNKLLEYAQAVRDIDDRLRAGYDLGDGGSRIIEQFFNTWNNMVFGVLYTASLLETNKTLTSKQYEIFLVTLNTISQYIGSFGHARE